MPSRQTTMEENFWKYTQKRSPDECWLWLGALNPKGYGWAWHGRRAHRVSWMLHHGPIPNGLLVCHSCDNPRCVNPKHLWLGTSADNQADKARKGRAARRPGSKHPLAKLTEEWVLAIRASAEPTDKIANRFGVSVACIRDVRSRKNWRHL